MKKHLLTLLMCLVSLTGLCQQRGHFILGGGTSVIFGKGSYDSPSNLFYTLEAGITYDLLEHLRLNGTLGGFRSVMSFTDRGWSPETANGAMARIGASYLFPLPSRHFQILTSLSAGYRLRIPPEADSPVTTRPDGAFLQAGIGTEILLGGLRLDLSLTGEITGQLRPAAGVKLAVLLP